MTQKLNPTPPFLNISAVQLGSLRQRQRARYKASMVVAPVYEKVYVPDILRDSWEPYRTDPELAELKSNRL